MDGSLNMVGYGLAAIGPGVGIGLIFAAASRLSKMNPARPTDDQEWSLSPAPCSR